MSRLFLSLFGLSAGSTAWSISEIRIYHEITLSNGALDWRKDYELPLPWPSLSRLSAPRCQARLWRTEGEKMAIREKFCHKTCLRSNHCCGQQQRLKEKLWGWLKLELEMHFIISFFSIIWLTHSVTFIAFLSPFEPHLEFNWKLTFISVKL